VIFSGGAMTTYRLSLSFGTCPHQIMMAMALVTDVVTRGNYKIARIQRLAKRKEK
jgi:hypothetical protein